MNQVLEPWIIPNVNNNNIYYVEAIHNDYEGFRILLRNDDLNGKILRITFNDYISYRNTDESYLIKLWENTDNKVLGKIFYIFSDSEYLDFFNKYSLGVYEDIKVKHYAIYTTSDCIDILSIQPPKIEWLE